MMSLLESKIDFGEFERVFSNCTRTKMEGREARKLIDGPRPIRTLSCTIVATKDVENETWLAVMTMVGRQDSFKYTWEFECEDFRIHGEPNEWVLKREIQAEQPISREEDDDPMVRAFERELLRRS